MAAAAQTPPRPAPLRVLVAEDRTEHRVWLVATLRAHGFDVSQARDGNELLDMLLAVPPRHFHVVICDQLMPGLHGTECLARASSRSKWIIVTSSRDPAIERAALQFGALGVLHKPFDGSGLTALLDQIVPLEPPTGTRRVHREPEED